MSDFATHELCGVILRCIVDCRKTVVKRGQTCIALQLVATRARGIALRPAFINVNDGEADQMGKRITTQAVSDLRSLFPDILRS